MSYIPIVYIPTANFNIYTMNKKTITQTTKTKIKNNKKKLYLTAFAILCMMLSGYCQSANSIDRSDGSFVCTGMAVKIRNAFAISISSIWK